jgi:hypothetical protein
MRIGADGEFLAVYGDDGEAERRRFLVLIEDHDRASIRRDSGWLPTWKAAIESLSRYPWPNLFGIFVDHSIADAVWNAIEDYQTRSGQTIRGSALDRWRSLCGRTQQPTGRTRLATEPSHS